MKITYNRKLHAIELKAEIEAENHQLEFVEAVLSSEDAHNQTKNDRGNTILTVPLKGK